MTQYEKMTSIELEQTLARMKNEKRIEELKILADIINTGEHGKRITAEADLHLVYLYQAGTRNLLYSIVNMKDWEQFTTLFTVLNSPSEYELQEMEYQAQESPESRRNGYGAENEYSGEYQYRLGGSLPLE